MRPTTTAQPRPDGSPLGRARALYGGALPPGGGGTLEDRRAGFERMLELLPPVTGSTADRFDVGDIACLRVDATGGEAVRAAVMLHGGGYVLGSATGYRAYASYLSAAARARVIVPEYRLAPEHRYPAAIEDAIATICHTYNEVGPGNTFLVGDSAGGGLALSSCLALRERGLPSPACILLLSPLVDLRAVNPTYADNSDVDPIVTQRGIQRAAEWYLDDAGPDRAPLAYPLDADLTGLPPVQILVGTDEVLLDDSRMIRTTLLNGRVPVEYAEYPDMVHCWPLFSSFLPEGRDALVKMARFADRYVPRAGDTGPLSSAADLAEMIPQLA
jgi:monoterpene epsilon-lactone hydrolase